MSRPWQHPNSGVYWFRRGVPADLRALVGKLEEKQSLKTKDPAVARQRHAKVLAEVEERWANLRAGSSKLTEREAHELAVTWHDRWLELYKDSPSSQTSWRVDLADRLFMPPPRTNKLDIDIFAPLHPDVRAIMDMEAACRDCAKETLQWRGLAESPENIRLVARAIGHAVQRASITLARYAKGDFGAGLSSDIVPRPILGAKVGVKFDELLRGWSNERLPAKKTLYEWTRVLRTFEKFLGHDDAGRVTADDVVRWKEAMISGGLRTRTVQNAKLAPVRAIFQWGYENRKLAHNPAEKVSVEIKVIATERKRSFTDEEARLILSNALSEKDSVRRWVPWLGAYSGARVSELCQLRTSDIIRIDGVWCMKFDPEAGPLKNSNSERAVPLHPALIESGFLKFVEEAKPGPIFPHLKPDKFGKRGGNGTKVIGRWVRALGITDTRLSPSHSWRHRIKTLGRKHGLAKDILEAITGHGQKSVADNYGEYPIEALYRELCKIPEIDLKSSVVAK